MEASQARRTQSDSSADQLATIASTIEKLRLKLLDLSLRNPLLNFKFTKRTLRLIDELPDQVFSSLIDGRSFLSSLFPSQLRQKSKSGKRPRSLPKSSC